MKTSLIRNSRHILWISSVLFVLSANVQAQSVTVDLNTEYQTIRGFGGMNHTSWINDLNADQRKKSFGNEPGEIGLSILRIHINPNPERWNLELPTAMEAQRLGAIVFATPWNAPAEVLDPDATLEKVSYDMYDEYAAHLDSFNSYMANNGAPLYAVSVQNEPDYGDWTRWTSEEMVTFMRENASVINNKVMAPESFQFRRAYTDPILNDSVASSYLDIVGGHIYGGGLFDYPLARDKGKDVWMTEHLTGSDNPEDNTWSLALNLGTEISNCMKANFNAYVWWYIRRFYGLITDDGNISKKGFVMSHFSKFIRFGAIRVDGIVSSAPNVDVTAYKTDTSLVIVVINKNTTSVSLDFTIQNGTIDTLTKFTTSATKNVVNDGGVSISGGIFSATLDASSITTFTSYPINGGEYGNIAPVADAGPDIAINDADGNGSEILLIDGSNSNDTDGTITNFNWSVNGVQLSLDTTFEYTVAIGEHVLVLTVTDNDGAMHSDTMNISVTSIYHTEIWFEAECGTFNGSDWMTTTDNTASHEKYVTVTPGIESIPAPTSDSNSIVFSFHISEPSQYKLWGRVISPTANDDSFWMRMDDSTWFNWNGIPAGADWHWDDVHNQSNDNPMIYQLDTGNHVLSICYREDGAKLDKLYLTNTGAIPAEMGEEADNCPVDTVPITPAIINTMASSISVFPNPATSEIQVHWNNAFNSLALFSMDGRSVLQNKYYPSMQDAQLDLNLEPGIYFLLLSNEYKSDVIKVIIE